MILGKKNQMSMQAANRLYTVSDIYEPKHIQTFIFTLRDIQNLIFNVDFFLLNAITTNIINGRKV